MMDETKTVSISYTKFDADVSRLDELLVIKPEKILCYSESFCLKLTKAFFVVYPLSYIQILYIESITYLLLPRID